MLLDSSAWIEFFRGTDNCKKVENILTTEENFTSIVTFAEIVNWCLRNRLEIVKNWGMLDSFIVATSLFYNLKILTKDSQFKDLADAEML